MIWTTPDFFRKLTLAQDWIGTRTGQLSKKNGHAGTMQDLEERRPVSFFRKVTLAENKAGNTADR